MEYNPALHHRKSIRLKGYDYASEGAYFVTICTQNREHLFGKIQNGEMVLNEAGEMIKKWWGKLCEKFPNILLDAFVVMPNHIHGIIGTIPYNFPDTNQKINEPVGVIPCNHPMKGENMISDERGENMVSPVREKGKMKIPNTYDGLGQYISWFKRMSTNEYIRGVKSQIFPPFEKHIWQHNYYEHIIRDEKDFERIANYILYNPQNWEKDCFYKF